MVGQIDNGRFVGGSFVCDNQRVTIGQGIGSLHVERAGEAHFAIGRSVAHHQLLVVDLFNVEHTVLITFHTTMETIGTIVYRNLIINTVNRELTLVDTVAITSDESTEIRLVVQIRLNIVETQYNVGKLTILIGRADRNDTGTIIHHGDFHTVGILQNIQVILFSVDFSLEISTVQLSLWRVVLLAARSKKQTACQKS